MTAKLTFILEDEGNGLSTKRIVDVSSDAANTEKVLLNVLLSLTELVLGKDVE